MDNQSKQNFLQPTVPKTNNRQAESEVHRRLNRTVDHTLTLNDFFSRAQMINLHITEKRKRGSQRSGCLEEEKKEEMPLSSTQDHNLLIKQKDSQSAQSDPKNQPNDL